jgi:RAD51-like protein 3
MTTFMRQLKALAAAYGLTFLVGGSFLARLPVFTRYPKVINNATPMTSSVGSQIRNPYSVFPTTVKKPALGPSFTFLTDATLWLSAIPNHDENDESSLVRVAEVFRSRTSVAHLLFT